MMNDRTKFIIYALGIFVSYFYFGILQERITRGRYGGDESGDNPEEGERFTYMMALCGIQCIVNWLYAHGELVRFSVTIQTFT